MEDRALMYALSELITTVDKMRGTVFPAPPRAQKYSQPTDAHRPAEEVNDLLKALVLFQYHRQAEALQLAFQEALQMMEAAVPEVWPEGPQNGQTPVNVHMLPISQLLGDDAMHQHSFDSDLVAVFQLTGPNSTANSIMASFQQQQLQSPSASQQGEHNCHSLSTSLLLQMALMCPLLVLLSQMQTSWYRQR